MTGDFNSDFSSDFLIDVSGGGIFGRPKYKHLIPVGFEVDGYYSIESQFTVPIIAEFCRPVSFQADLIGKNYVGCEFYVPLVVITQTRRGQVLK